MHREAKASDADLFEICKFSQCFGVENSALQPQCFAKRHPEGLGRIQSMHSGTKALLRQRSAISEFASSSTAWRS
jgi:hypothetical protein